MTFYVFITHYLATKHLIEEKYVEFICLRACGKRSTSTMTILDIDGLDNMARLVRDLYAYYGSEISDIVIEHDHL